MALYGLLVFQIYWNFLKKSMCMDGVSLVGIIYLNFQRSPKKSFIKSL